MVSEFTPLRALEPECSSILMIIMFLWEPIEGFVYVRSLLQASLQSKKCFKPLTGFVQVYTMLSMHCCEAFLNENKLKQTIRFRIG